MVQESRGIHHFHKRKRVHQKKEVFPHPNKYKRLMDDAVYVLAVFGPVITIPQISKIWIEQNASGLSLISWIGYLLGSIFWLIYGIIHKEKPIIFTNAMWIAFHFLIVLGIIVYG